MGDSSALLLGSPTAQGLWPTLAASPASLKWAAINACWQLGSCAMLTRKYN
jgi:hypothetical protein